MSLVILSSCITRGQYSHIPNFLSLKLTGVVHQRLPRHLPSQHRHRVIHVMSHRLWDRIARNRWLVHQQQCVYWTCCGKVTFFLFFFRIIWCAQKFQRMIFFCVFIFCCFFFFFRSGNSHWVSKHFQDFEQDAALRSQTIAFLDDITCSPNLLPSEHRAASQLLRLLCRDDIENNQMHLDKLLTPPKVSWTIKIINLYRHEFQICKYNNWWFRRRVRKVSKRCRLWKSLNKWLIWIIRYSSVFEASKLYEYRII